MDTDVDRPRYRITAHYRVTPRLTAGAEFNLAADEVVPNANWVALTESDRRPMVSFGLSSDRIFSPPGKMMYYGTIAKSIPGMPIAPYIGLAYSETDEDVNVPWGVNFGLAKQWDALFMSDSRRRHFLVTYKQDTWNVTVVAVDIDNPVFGVSFGWGVGK